MSLFYKIGGLTIKTENNYNENAFHQLSFYETEPTETPDITITVHRDCVNMQVPEGTTLVAEVNKRHWCHTKDGGFLFYDKVIEYCDEIYNMMVADRDFRNVDLYLCPASYLKLEKDDPRAYNLMQDILCAAMLVHNGAIVHSSSIAVDNKGLLFSALSGTGKSTHTGLWLKHVPGTVIVNDDKPIIRFEDDIPYLYGAPWSGKNTIHKNMRVPMKALIFIERAETCSLTPMNPLDAVWQLLDAVIKPSIPELAEKNMDFICRLVEKVPIYLLRCNISEDAVNVAKEALK